MRYAIRIVVVTVVVGLAGVALAQDGAFKVIGHAGTTPDSVTTRDLARIFLKQKSRWPSGQSAEPVDQKSNVTLRETFADRVLDRSLAMVESYWQAQVFSGRNTPPTALASDAAVVDYVRSHPGAVGYVSRSAPTDGVKTISVTD
jgi:hypothetical protein